MMFSVLISMMSETVMFLMDILRIELLMFEVILVDVGKRISRAEVL